MSDLCAEMRLLLQADVDGELSPAEAARVAAHVDGCATCAALQTGLLGLSTRLQQDVPRFEAPASLRLAVAARLPAPRRPLRVRAPVFGGGVALAACVALLLLWPQGDRMPAMIVDGHLRALQPGHLMDVASTDQHTVKPWFDGRLDYAPPVKDLVKQGFPLQGGRLDVLGGRPVAALVYGHDKHEIDLFVVHGGAASAETGAISGYNYISWSEGGMTFWAVSDVAAADLATFARLWRQG